MLIFVPPTVCGSLWHNCPGIWTSCWFYYIEEEDNERSTKSSDPVKSWAHIFSEMGLIPTPDKPGCRKCFVTSYPSDLISLLLQSIYCWQIPDPPGAAPDRRHQTLEEGRCLLWLSSLHPIRLSTVSSVRSPSLPGFLTGIYFNIHTLNSFSGSVLILNLIQCLCLTSMSLTNFYVLKCDAFNSTFSCTFPF